MESTHWDLLSLSADEILRARQLYPGPKAYTPHSMKPIAVRCQNSTDRKVRGGDRIRLTSILTRGAPLCVYAGLPNSVGLMRRTQFSETAKILENEVRVEG